MTLPDSGSRHRRALVPILAPWITGGLIDSLAAASAYARPAPWQFAMEFGLLAGMGWAQWTFGRGWLRSPLLPAAVFLGFGSLPHAPSGFFHAAPYLAGIVLTTSWVVQRIQAKVALPSFVGVLAAAFAVLGVQIVDHHSQASVTTGAAHTTADPGLGTGTKLLDGPPIVVISVDTLRADSALSMKSVARLASRGAVWPRAMSTSSWTLPALASLQTGLMPSEHGAGCLEDGHCQGLSASVRTVAEELHAQGWVTGAVVANPWAGAGMGFARGFDEFVDPGQPGRRLIIGGAQAGLHGQDDARTVDAAIDWLARAPARGFYLWVHMMGPHMPYLHSPLDKMRRLDPVTLRSSYPSSQEQRNEIRAAYDAEVDYSDAQVMRLLDALADRGTLESGVVILTSDHGEEFWEHGGVEHGHSHHGEITDVPLVLVAPGVEAGERPGVASLLDVASTIRSVAGLTPGGIDLRSGISSDRVATAWGGIILRLDCSARDPLGRLIDEDCSKDLNAMRRFDLAIDPGERLPQQPDEGDPMVAALRRIASPPRQAGGPVASDRLRALGYLQ